ncbi:uncharacterized protein LOC134534362 isoform X2 [Bacillus rossius redtenbacheri]|uniref:uncharacterized protein LOC134534362 isoform X2 n=1 Tax=Bacillus rossius redtenbacheri TaxID=93214 RepID=UPI002FDEAF99
MADENPSKFLNCVQPSVVNLFKYFVILNKNMLKLGLSINDLRKMCTKASKVRKEHNQVFGLQFPNCTYLCFLVMIVFISILVKVLFLETVVKNALGTRCVLPNNYFVWEATRPVTDCSMCKDVTNVTLLANVSRLEFQKYAYSPQPMLVKGAALHWPAMQAFSYHFFKDIYETIEGAYESVEEECQILTFKTEFKSLQEVFAMSEARVQQHEGEQPWYVGWSNCHPEVLGMMRRYYSAPHFLPEDAEHAHMDYIFIGYQQGAVMHMDYISRLMWQAQLRGRKRWTLVPPPECSAVCRGLSFQVDPGDVVLLDTRQWYHDTVVDSSEMSVTVSSEYG